MQTGAFLQYVVGVDGARCPAPQKHKKMTAEKEARTSSGPLGIPFRNALFLPFYSLGII
jgi:hypothetical protein